MPAWLLACFASDEVKEIPPEERLDMYDTEGVTKIEPVAKKVEGKANINSSNNSNGAKPKDKARKVLVRMDTQEVLKVDSLVDVWFPKEEFYSGDDALDDLLVREKIQEAKEFVQVLCEMCKSINNTTQQ